MAYLYRHIREDNGETFYIGISSEQDKKYRRAYDKNSRNFIWKRITSKTGYKVEILFDDILIDEAKKKEIELITHYGKLYGKEGCLANIKDGGDLGLKHSEESRIKMSNSKKGRKLTDEWRKKISDSGRGRKNTEEHNQKIRESKIGKRHSQNSIEKMRSSMIGKLSGDKNPSSIMIEIFNQNDELMFICNGNFDAVCSENGLPSRALRRSYYDNGRRIYTSKLCKKSVSELRTEFIGWYAIRK